MIRNIDGTYIYLVVPAKYECVYTKLLVKMTDLGIDLLKDCASTCRGVNRQVLNCWNMFQAACTAYELGEVKKADLLINYINASLNFACTSEQAPTISNFKLNVTNVVGNQTIIVTEATFNIDYPNKVKANSLKIVHKNTDTVIAENLSVISPVSIDSVNLDVKVGETHTWYGVITDTDGKEHQSNDYSITVTALDAPSITGFKLNINPTITGSQEVSLNKATFTITNKDNVKPNSLSIKYLDDNDTIATDLSIDSPVDFGPVSVSMIAGKTYRFQTTIEDKDGKEYSSNIYTISCVQKPSPAISNFKLNIANTVEGGKSYNITQATFSITNVSSAKANSLKIIEMDKDGEDYTIVSNLPLTSPANFSAYSLAAIAGSTYRFQCAIQDENDNWVYSGMYTVVATAPVERNTMYYGHTTVNGSEGALAFKNKKATELMAMPHEDKEIVGNSEVTFVIHQEQNVHWLLIPTEKLELIHAEYGTVLITTLWDKEQNRGAYKQPFDAGEYNGVAYTMFFLYSPGTFDDDIRITVKKK